MSGTLRFLSHLRTGLAAALGSTTSSAANAEDDYSVTVGGVKMSGRFELHGPGQVAAIERAQVLREFPSPGANDHEPNLFAHIELRAADLLWRFTPAGASGGKLRPWLVLVVVELDDRVSLTSGSGRLPVLKTPVSELPTLAESWAWAHVQVSLADPAADLEALYRAEPERFLSRLICPRNGTKL